MRSRERDFVAALARGLNVIEALGASGGRLTLSDIARGAQLTRAAARRYLLTLARLGYAETDGKRFALAPGVLRLGYAYLSTASLPRLAQPVLETIGERTREVASLAMLDGTEILFLARSAQRRIVSATTSVGTRLPAYCTAMGRVLLASLPDEALEDRLRALKPRKLTPKTRVSMREIRGEIALARKRGYALSDEELELGLRSIAVLVPDARGRAQLALAVSLQASRMTPAGMVEKLLPALQTASRSLAQML